MDLLLIYFKLTSEMFLIWCYQLIYFFSLIWETEVQAAETIFPLFPAEVSDTARDTMQQGDWNYAEVAILY